MPPKLTPWAVDEPGEMGDSLPLVQLGADAPAVFTSVGGDFVCSLMSDGLLKCTGGNARGQLGLMTCIFLT